jgi:TLD
MTMVENAAATSPPVPDIGVNDRIDEEKNDTGRIIHHKNGDFDTPKTTTTTTTVVPLVVASRNRRVRKNLKKSMAQLRGSLTPHETKFLQGLLDTGTDQEIQAATRTIVQNPSLFLISSSTSSKNGDEEYEIALINEPGVEKETSSGSSLRQRHEETNVASSFSSSQASIGSEQRREKRLEVRRSFGVYDQLWKAYEEGTLPGADNDAVAASSNGGVERRRNNDGAAMMRSSNHSAPADLSFRSSLPLNGVVVVRDGGGGGLATGVGMNNNSRGGRRLSRSVTAAKVHRISVTSSVAAAARKSSSSSMVMGRGRRRISGTGTSFRTSSTSSASSVSAFSNVEQQQYATKSRSSDLRTESSTRRKSVSFSDTEDHLASSLIKQDDVEEKDNNDRLETKEIKPCLVKKKPNDEQQIQESNNQGKALTALQQRKQQDTSNSYCNTICLPFFRFFTRFRRVSIASEVSSNDARDKAMPPIPVKDLEEDGSSVIGIPARTSRHVRIRGDSFDETMSCERVGAVLARQRTSSSSSRHGVLKRTFSDDCLNSKIRQSSTSRDGVMLSEERGTGNNNDENINVVDYYDAWLSHVQGGDFPADCEKNYNIHPESPPSSFLDFLIIGSSANDKRALPHVLSPPLMQSLQAFLPWNKRGENFWLKYSLVRDGACMITLLQACRGAKYTFLAIETIGGEVFGAFCGKPWRKSNGGQYGSAESFIWKMKLARQEQARSVLDQAAMEREIEVYPYSHNNDFIQVCKSDRLSVGGGTGDTIDTYTILPAFAEDSEVEYHDWGPAIYLTKTLLQGTSSPCLTFCSPALCPRHADGSFFEIINLEVWTLTPAINLEQAEQVECGQLFFEEHSQFIKMQ